jgi:PmbA protein
MSAAMSTQTILDIAQSAVKTALARGAQEAAANIDRTREVETVWRDGKLEKTQEATSRTLGLSLYVDGRYANVSSSDLRPEALARFIADSVVLTRALGQDPHRSLPDPKLYAGQAKVDLQLADPHYAALTSDDRRRLAKELEAAARTVPGSDRILSVTGSISDSSTDSLKVHSNGFIGSRLDTTYFLGAQVSVKDPDGRRPEDYCYAGSRFFGELPATAALGQDAARRTLARIGSKKGDSAVLSMAIDNRAAGRMVAFLLGPLSGASIQQKRSFLEGRLGQTLGSPLLTLTDDPLIPKAFGSRLFDHEGIAAKARPVFEAGILRTYFIDTYYAKKLGMAPTTGGASNLVWKLGPKGQEAILADLKEGIFVTGFLGGNSNGTTGDFSLGVQGFRIRNGRLAEPVGEMNIAGNHLEFWKSLAAVGNDPYPYSALRTPTLVFEGVQFAGN